MPLTPLCNQVVINALERSARTNGGRSLPDMVTGPPQEAEVQGVEPHSE
jgi:co-chaperonin GroES (HSP10)